jgi:hypothetical protein
VEVFHSSYSVVIYIYTVYIYIYVSILYIYIMKSQLSREKAVI